jgi:tRNA nucleotidyltransferase (CCA-adding enzyme)
VAHGTITVRIDHFPIEITTYRVDGAYRDHRHPEKVCFTQSLREDLSRRDFTINGLAYHKQTGVIDLFGGREDLQAKVVRAIGKAEDRFEEDALRMLRAVRFASQLNFTIERQTQAAILEKCGLLSAISGERIREELCKFLLGGRQLWLLEETGIAKVIMPELKGQGLWQKAIPFAPADKSIRFAAMLCEANESGEQILNRLKFDRRTKREILTLIEWKDRRIEPTPQGVRRLVARLGKEAAGKLLSLKRAFVLALGGELAEIFNLESLYQDVLRENPPLSIGDLAVSGTDLKEIGCFGKEIGDKLQRLLDMVIEKPSCNQREFLLSMAKQMKK